MFTPLRHNPLHSFLWEDVQPIRRCRRGSRPTLFAAGELEVSHSGSIQAMTDQQIEDAIATIKGMMAERAARTIDVTPTTSSSEPPSAGSDGR